MHVRRLNNIDPEVYAVIFQTGDEFMSGLDEAAREFKLTASHFSGIGAFSDLELAYFDWEAKEYQPIPQMSEQVEVLTLAGDIAISDGEPLVHAHVVVGRRDGSAFGGHIKKAWIRPTLELIVTESPTYLRRKLDPESGLPLITATDSP